MRVLGLAGAVLEGFWRQVLGVPSHHCKMPLGDGGRCDGGGVVMVHGSGSQSWDCQDGGCQDEVCV